MAIEITECRGVSAGESASTSAGIAVWFCRRACLLTLRGSAIVERPSRDLLASLARALDRRLDVSLMRGAFEAALAQVIPVRTVHLREVGSRWGGRVDAAGRRIDHPRSARRAIPSSQALLEVTFDPGLPARRLGLSDARHGGQSRGAGPRDRTVATAAGARRAAQSEPARAATAPRR